VGDFFISICNTIAAKKYQKDISCAKTLNYSEIILKQNVKEDNSLEGIHEKVTFVM